MNVNGDGQRGKQPSQYGKNVLNIGRLLFLKLLAIGLVLITLFFLHSFEYYDIIINDILRWTHAAYWMLKRRDRYGSRPMEEGTYGRIDRVITSPPPNRNFLFI